MKRVNWLLALGFMGLSPSSAVAESKIGVVAFRIKGCDYYPVITTGGISILEWFGGYDPDKDDQLVGEIETYGFKNVILLPNERESRAWIEDYWLSNDRAIEKLRDKCNLD
jgi:hypothetical protein